MAEIILAVAVITSLVIKITFVVTWIIFTLLYWPISNCSGLHKKNSVAGTSLSVANITFVIAEITFKVAVITSSVAKIISIVAEITFKVAVITSSVVKITFVVTQNF